MIIMNTIQQARSPDATTVSQHLQQHIPHSETHQRRSELPNNAQDRTDNHLLNYTPENVTSTPYNPENIDRTLLNSRYHAYQQRDVQRHQQGYYNIQFNNHQDRVEEDDEEFSSSYRHDIYHHSQYQSHRPRQSSPGHDYQIQEQEFTEVTHTYERNIQEQNKIHSSSPRQSLNPIALLSSQSYNCTHSENSSIAESEEDPIPPTTSSMPYIEHSRRNGYSIQRSHKDQGSNKSVSTNSSNDTDPRINEDTRADTSRNRAEENQVASIPSSSRTESPPAQPDNLQNNQIINALLMRMIQQYDDSGQNLRIDHATSSNRNHVSQYPFPQLEDGQLIVTCLPPVDSVNGSNVEPLPPILVIKFPAFNSSITSSTNEIPTTIHQQSLPCLQQSPEDSVSNFVSRNQPTISPPDNVNIIGAGNQNEVLNRNKQGNQNNAINTTNAVYNNASNVASPFTPACFPLLPPRETTSRTTVERRKKKNQLSFPQILMKAIQECPDERVVAWLADGLSFVIRDKDRFQNEILGRHFPRGRAPSKYDSFVRKLHRWGFQRLAPGTSVECFHNPCFCRDDPHLTLEMVQLVNLPSTLASVDKDKGGALPTGTTDREHRRPSLEGLHDMVLSNRQT